LFILLCFANGKRYATIRSYALAWLQQMIAKLREILLTQYVGAILIALLVLQAAIEVITRAVRIGFWFFNHRHVQSVLGGASNEVFAWDNLVFSAVTAALYLLTAYGLARWLYLLAEPKVEPDIASESSEQGEQS
jgi:hypothetical protein